MMSATENAKEDIFLCWDPSQIYRDYADYLRKEDPDLSKDEALEEAMNDPDVLGDPWDNLIDLLGDKMNQYNSDELRWRVFRIEGPDQVNITSTDGAYCFYANDGEGFLRAIFPKGDCLFIIYAFDNDKRFLIRRWPSLPVDNIRYYVEVLND